MKRLRDEANETDPRAREAARLLRGIGPLAEDPQRQRRVRLKLGSPRPRSPFWLWNGWLSRPVIVMTTLVATVGVAAAMAGGGWTYARQQVAQLFTDAATTNDPPPARRTTNRSRSRQAARVEPPLEQPGTAPAPAPAVETPALEPTPTPQAVMPERREQRPESRRKVSGPEKAAPNLPPLPAGAAMNPTGPGASLMIEAMQARRAGDFARTERLLTRYRIEYPNGELQEEALVLSLEAATQLGSGRADALARTYLTRFPNGRFRDRVAQMLSAKGR